MAYLQVDCYPLSHRLSIRHDSGLRWRHEYSTDMLGNDEDWVRFTYKEGPVRYLVFKAMKLLRAPADDTTSTAGRHPRLAAHFEYNCLGFDVAHRHG